MKKLALTLSVALASLLAANGYAQTKGEADADQSKAMPAKAATKEEKAAAKSARKAEGKAAVKENMKTTGADTPAGTTKVSKEERKAAAAQRKASATQARKAGETQGVNK
ncbi:MAG TPA: hypothetical protein VIE63_15010 [Ramlibacter sp.]